MYRNLAENMKKKQIKGNQCIVATYVSRVDRGGVLGAQDSWGHYLSRFGNLWIFYSKLIRDAAKSHRKVSRPKFTTRKTNVLSCTHLILSGGRIVDALGDPGESFADTEKPMNCKVKN